MLVKKVIFLLFIKIFIFIAPFFFYFFLNNVFLSGEFFKWKKNPKKPLITPVKNSYAVGTCKMISVVILVTKKKKKTKKILKIFNE